MMKLGTHGNPGEDRQSYRAAVEKRKADFDAQLASALQITRADTGSFSVVRVLSEIFAVVYIPALEVTKAERTVL